MLGLAYKAKLAPATAITFVTATAGTAVAAGTATGALQTKRTTTGLLFDRFVFKGATLLRSDGRILASSE